MTAFDWLIVLAINGAVIGYGIYLARGTKTSSEWFLGARALPWWAVGLSMFATNVDNADLVGVTGTTYSEGLHIVSVYAISSVIGGVLAAFFVVPQIYRAGFYTNAEYLEFRFGPAMRAFSALIQIQYRGSMLGMMIWSAYLLLTRLVEVEPVWAWVLIVSLVILSGIYTAWGGLKAVVWTDAAQGIVMIVGALIIFAAAWNAVGGWSAMTAALEQQDLADMAHIGRYRGDDGNTSPLVIVLGWTIIASGYWTVNHTQTMRLMGTRSLWDMRMAALWGVALSLPIMVVSSSLGLFAHAVPELQSIDQPDTVYPLLANMFLGPGLKGLVVAGVVAAITSTFDSMGSALSAIFTRDIYARFMVRDREDRHYVLVGRIATVAVLAVGFLYLPFIIKQKNMIQAFTTLIPVFVTPLFTTYVAGVLTRAHRRSGLIGLLVGSAYGLIALYDREVSDVVWLSSWFTSRWAALCWSVLITGLTMAIVSAGLTSEPRNKPPLRRDMGWLERSRDELPPLREHPFTGPVPFALQPALWAAISLVVSGYVVFQLLW